MVPKGESSNCLCIRKLLWLIVPMSLPGASYAADQIYLRAMEQKLCSLERHLLSRHADCSYLGAGYSRFGVDLAAPEFSLFADFNSWATKRAKSHSRLDYDIGCGTTLSHAYLLAVFHFDRGGSQSSHAFIWSPRRREFVHHENWGNSCQTGCSWRRDPRCVGRCE